MSTNSTGAIVCNLTSTFVSVRDVFTLITYTVFPPFYITFGSFSHITALLTFLKPSKADKAYRQQIYVSIGKIVQIFCCSGFYILFYNLAGQDYSGKVGGGAMWFKSSVVCMWYTAYVAPVLSSALTTVTTLLTACMAADRAVAISKPLWYRTNRKKVLRLTGLVLSWFLGLLFSVETAFRYVLASNGTVYMFQSNPWYSSSMILYIDSQCRNGARLIGLVAILIFSLIMIQAYTKRRRTKVGAASQAPTQADVAKRNLEKTVFVISLFQCFTVAVTSVLPFIYNMSLFVAPAFGKCEGVMTSVVNDLLLQILNTLEFYVLFAVNDRFRRSVMRVLRRQKERTDATVKSRSQNVGSQRVPSMEVNARERPK